MLLLSNNFPILFSIRRGMKWIDPQLFFFNMSQKFSMQFFMDKNNNANIIFNLYDKNVIITFKIALITIPDHFRPSMCDNN